MHAEHVLHGLAGDTNLLADDFLAFGLAQAQELQRNGIGVVDIEFRVTFPQRRHGALFTQAGMQFGTQRIAQGDTRGVYSFRHRRSFPCRGGINHHSHISE